MGDAKPAGYAEQQRGKQRQADQLADKERGRQQDGEADQEVLVQGCREAGLAQPDPQQIRVRQHLSDEFVIPLGVATVIDDLDAALRLLLVVHLGALGHGVHALAFRDLTVAGHRHERAAQQQDEQHRPAADEID